MDAMKQAVKDVMEGKGTIREVASRYAVPFSSLGRKVKKMRQVVSGVSAGDTEAVSSDASPVLQENVLLETDNSGAMGSSVSVEPATVTPVVDGLETIGDRTETEGVSVASSVSSEATITSEMNSVAERMAGNEGVSVGEGSPVGASADSSLELEKLRAEIARLRSDNQVLSDAMGELEKLALEPPPQAQTDPNITYGCGINPHKFKKGNCVQCEACQLEVEFFFERVDKILHQVFEPRPVSPEERIERYKQGLKDWGKLNAEISLSAEFFESQDPAIVEARNKMKGAEQRSLDAVDFKQWLLDVKFPGTTEQTVMEMMGHWFKELPPPPDREPAVSPSLN